MLEKILKNENTRFSCNYKSLNINQRILVKQWYYYIERHKKKIDTRIYIREARQLLNLFNFGFGQINLLNKELIKTKK